MRNRTLAVLVTLLLAVFFAAGVPSHSNTADLSQPAGISARRLLPDYQPPAKYDAATAASSQTASSVGAPVSENLSLNVARRGHTSTELSDGRVAIIGGQNQNGPVSEVEVLDVQSQSIKVVAGLRVARSRHTATRLADGSVLVAGGWNQKTSFDSTEIFNPETNSFSRGPRLSIARAAHTATVLQDGRILFAGGSPDASAEIFDPTTHTTTLLKARMIAARSFHATALLDDGNVLIVGGVDQDGLPLRSAEIFDSKSQTFSPTVAPMRIKRLHPTLRVLPDGKVQIIGGDYDGTMEVYDPAKNQFSAAAHLAPTANIFPTAKVLESRTRAAFIDSKMALDESAAADPAKPLQHYSIANKKALDGFNQLLERADYSSAEMSGSNRAVIAGGVGKKGEYVRSVVVMKSSTASITTNKTEYLQGEWPAISGSGWQPHEKINIVRQQARTGHKRTSIEVVADEHGSFTTGGMPSADSPRGMTYTLTAMGERSGDVAQTTYDDALPRSAPKPKTAALSVPILFRDASFEVDEGLLVWEMRSGGPSKVKPPEFSIQSVFSSTTFDFATIENQPCLGIPGSPCSGFDVQLKSDSFITFGGSVDGDILMGNLKVSETVNGTIIVQVTAESVSFGPFTVPGTGVTFGADVAGVTAEITLGIVVRAGITFTAPGTTFITTLNFNQTSAIEFKDPPKLTGDLTATVDFKLVETAGGCIKISVGPEVGVAVGIDAGVCDIGFDAAASIAPFIEGCLNIDNSTACPTYSIPISVGVVGLLEGTLNLCVTDVTASIDQDLFKIPIATFTGGLNDTTPPTIVCPSDIMQGTDPGTCGATVVFAPTASDGACPQPTFVCAPAAGTFFNKGTTTVTCTATDGAGNTASCSFTVTVKDAQGPTVTCPGNITQGNDANQCSAVVTFAATATDLCDGPVTPTCTPASGATFAKGTTTVTCTATDAAGNQSSPCTFTVKVNDTQKPTISCPGNITRGTDPDLCSAVVTLAPTTADNCDTGLVPVCNPASGSIFPKGTTDVTCTVTDTSGNQSSACSFTVTVNDTQGPKIACGSVTPRTANADANCQAPVPDVRASVQAQSSDNCTANGSLTVTQSPVQGSMVSGAGAHPIDVTVTDAAGNSTHCTVPFTVFDITPPTITCPADVISVAKASCPIAISNVATFPNPTVTDNCPGATFVCNPPSGATFPVGTTSVTCTATDASGNTASCSFTVTAFSFCLQDETNPGNVVLVNALTGDFSFCCDGVPIASGRGDLTTRGCIGSIDASKGDRQVHIQWDTAANNGAGAGTAYVQKRSNKLVCQITDKNMANNTCQCGSPAPPTSPRKPPKERAF